MESHVFCAFAVPLLEHLVVGLLLLEGHLHQHAHLLLLHLALILQFGLGGRRVGLVEIHLRGFFFQLEDL